MILKTTNPALEKAEAQQVLVLYDCRTAVGLDSPSGFLSPVIDTHSASLPLSHTHTPALLMSRFSPPFPAPSSPYTPTLVQPEPQGAQTVSEVRSVLWLCCCLSLGLDGDRRIRRSHVAIDLMGCGVGTHSTLELLTSHVC